MKLEEAYQQLDPDAKYGPEAKAIAQENRLSEEKVKCVAATECPVASLTVRGGRKWFDNRRQSERRPPKRSPKKKRAGKSRSAIAKSSQTKSPRRSPPCSR